MLKIYANDSGHLHILQLLFKRNSLNGSEFQKRRLKPLLCSAKRFQQFVVLHECDTDEAIQRLPGLRDDGLTPLDRHRQPETRTCIADLHTYM